MEMYREIRLKSAVSLIMATFLIFLIASCASFYHGVAMKGSIIEASNSDVYLCIGSRDGATVGQELDVYKVTRRQSYVGTVSVPIIPSFIRELSGKVKITEIVDEHFAKAKVISGKAEKHDVVELDRP